MDLAKTNCFGPPFITAWGLFAFALAASLLLVAAWAWLGTRALVLAWWATAASGWCMVLWRLWWISGFQEPRGWWVMDALFYLLVLVLATMLSTLASAVLWTVFPRASRLFHVSLSFVLLCTAVALASIAVEATTSVLYRLLA